MSPPTISAKMANALNAIATFNLPELLDFICIFFA
jgi:hypothetical protein